MTQKTNKLEKVEKPVEKPQMEKLTVRDILNELLKRTSNSMKRLRVLEQGADSLINRINSLESTMLEQRKELAGNISDLGKRISDAEDRLAKIEITLREIIAQLKNMPTMAKVRELEQFIEIYNPLKSQFVTREEVERLIEERKG